MEILAEGANSRQQKPPSFPTRSADLAKAPAAEGTTRFTF
jgi:hypothetical protein